MYSIMLVLSLMVSADLSEKEDELRRLDRLFKQLEHLLQIYDAVELPEFERGAEDCVKRLREKYHKKGEEYDYDSMTIGTRNTILLLQAHLLKEIIEVYKIQLNKNPKDMQMKNKLKDYKKRYEELMAFPGYD